MASKKYSDLSKEELVRLLEARDRQGKTRFGLVWEANEIERDRALNSDFVALDLVPDQCCGDAPWRNLIIEGDNFDALRYLRMAYAGRVKCIYIDPPYNTGNRDFVYNDRFVDKEDQWRHSKWCEFMYQRLSVARALLSEDGAILVSIDDNEVAPLRLMLDRVFGQDNFLAALIWEKGKKGDAKFFSVTHEYVLAVAQSKQALLNQGIVFRRKKPGVDAVLAKYQELRAVHGSDHDAIRKDIMAWYRGLPKDNPAKSHKHYNCSDDRGLYFADNFHGPDDGRESRPRYDILHPITGKPCKKPSTGWRWEEARTKQALAENPPRIHFGPDESTIPCRKSYLFEIDSEPFPSVFYRDGRAATLEVERIIGKGEFSFPKSTDVISDFVRLITCSNDLVLDFFAGSGTTAHAVMRVNAEDGGNRRFILVSNTEATGDEPEKNLCRDVCAKRVRRVIEGVGEAPGLPGDFAYLRCRRLPQDRLTRIQHEQVWLALQMMHRETFYPFRRGPFCWSGDATSALMYVPRFREEDMKAVRKQARQSGAVLLYSWEPSLFARQLKSKHIQLEPIPESLARRFGQKG